MTAVVIKAGGGSRCSCAGKLETLIGDDPEAGLCDNTTFFRCVACSMLYELRVVHPCAEGCRGWAHFNINEAREGVERCDMCGLFPDDDVATAAHAAHCHCGAEAGQPAQRCHRCAREFEHRQRFEADERIYCSPRCGWLTREGCKPDARFNVSRSAAAALRKLENANDGKDQTLSHRIAAALRGDIHWSGLLGDLGELADEIDPDDRTIIN